MKKYVLLFLLLSFIFYLKVGAFNQKINEINIRVYKNKLMTDKNFWEKYIQKIDEKLYGIDRKKLIELKNIIDKKLLSYSWEYYNIYKYIKFKSENILNIWKQNNFENNNKDNNLNICNDFDCIIQKLNSNQEKIEADILLNYSPIYKTFHWKYKINIEKKWNEYFYKQNIVSNELSEKEINKNIEDYYKKIRNELYYDEYFEFNLSETTFKYTMDKKDYYCIASEKNLLNYLNNIKELNNFNYSDSISYELNCKNIVSYPEWFPEELKIISEDFPDFLIKVYEQTEKSSEWIQAKISKGYEIHAKKETKNWNWTTKINFSFLIFLSDYKNFENELKNDKDIKELLKLWAKIYKKWNYYSLNVFWNGYSWNYYERLWFEEIK